MATNVPFTDDRPGKRQALESAAETGSDAGSGEVVVVVGAGGARYIYGSERARRSGTA